MKNIIWAVFAIAICLFTISCDDDDKIERPDYTQVKCKLELGTGWLNLYDVKVEYMTPDGQKKSVILDKEKWEYSEKVDGQYKRFFYKAVATAKRTTFDTSDPMQKQILSVDQDLTYTHEFYYYEKETSAHSIKPKEEGRIVKAGTIEAYVAEHPTIELFKHNITVGQK